MEDKWQFRVVSHEEFLAGQRRARIPEEVIKWLEEMAPKVILASGDEGESLVGSSVGAMVEPEG